MPPSEPDDLQRSERSWAQNSKRTWAKPQVRRVVLTDIGGKPDSPRALSLEGGFGDGYNPNNS